MSIDPIAILSADKIGPWPLKQIAALAKRETDAIGFLPFAAYAEYIASDGPLPKGVLIAVDFDEVVGFLAWRISEQLVDVPVKVGGVAAMKSRRVRHLKIVQTCVDPAVRRKSVGLALVERVKQIARMHVAEFISLWCADDLAANAFWESDGFTFTGVRTGGQRRGRDHNGWRCEVRRKVQRAKRERRAS